jgi:hypothetical protein
VINPRDSHRRTTGGVTLHTAAAWRIEVTRSASVITRTLTGLHRSQLAPTRIQLEQVRRDPHRPGISLSGYVERDV